MEYTKMNSFVNQAINEPVIAAYTDNGAVTNATSGDDLVNLFFLIGASRGKNISVLFERAYASDPVLARKMLMWARDVRGGAGERETVRNLLKYMERFHKKDLVKLLPVVPVYGRWDDVLIFNNKDVWVVVCEMIKNALLVEKNGLCAKWMPRQKAPANIIRKHLKMTPKEWRKLLVSLTDVVENKMCANEWSEIDYSHVPSVAANRLKNAFARHDGERYRDYLDRLSSGDTSVKVNAGAIFPHDVLKEIGLGSYYSKSLSKDADDLINAQWKALPNYLGSKTILPIVDVSGSMTTNISPGTTALDVSVSLGLYLADKQSGAFSDVVMTFSDNPEFVQLKGENIIQKARTLCKADWGMSTNLERSFDLVLKTAVKGNVPASDMPDYLLILSDMEFNQCIRNPNSTIYESAKVQFEKHGYKMPNVVFWNLNGRAGNNPVTIRDQYTALVSGYSPSILKSVLSADSVNPYDIMVKTITNERYDLVK
jgi:hypothetical protein